MRLLHRLHWLKSNVAMSKSMAASVAATSVQAYICQQSSIGIAANGHDVVCTGSLSLPPVGPVHDCHIVLEPAAKEENARANKRPGFQQVHAFRTLSVFHFLGSLSLNLYIVGLKANILDKQ